MITIFHGADTSSSRKFFLDLKQQEKESILIDGPNTTLTDLIQIFEGGELFSETKYYFIEQLIGKKSRNKGTATSGKKSRELDQVIEYLNSQQDNNIYLWEDAELTKTTLNKFKKHQERVFKLPQTLFSFLENLRPGNGPRLLSLFHTTIESSDVEMVFFMMIRQIRQLLALVDPVSDQIDEVKRMAPWQKTKLQSQADSFEVKELINLYKNLYGIEKAIKTGNLSGPLSQTIDFLLLTI